MITCCQASFILGVAVTLATQQLLNFAGRKHILRVSILNNESYNPSTPENSHPAYEELLPTEADMEEYELVVDITVSLPMPEQRRRRRRHIIAEDSSEVEMICKCKQQQQNPMKHMRTVGKLELGTDPDGNLEFQAAPSTENSVRVEEHALAGQKVTLKPTQVKVSTTVLIKSPGPKKHEKKKAPAHVQSDYIPGKSKPKKMPPKGKPHPMHLL